MDPNSIYVKTISGEEAIQQRTRVIQRNVRMVLILVDGQSSVSDLCRKTGNPQLTENALSELEKGGFIELKVEQHDSLWEESKRVAEEIRSAAIEKSSLLLKDEKGEKKEKYPDFQHSLPSTPVVPGFKIEPSGMPISMHSVFDTRDVADFSISQFSLAPSEPAAAVIAPRSVEQAPQKKEAKLRAKLRSKARVVKPSFFAQLKALWVSAERDLGEERGGVKPIRRGPKRRLAWPVIVLICLMCLFGAGFLAVTFYPYGTYLPRVEAAFARSVGRPVAVGAMRIDVYPNPGVLLTGVRMALGKQDLLIEEIRLQPDLGSLLSSRIIFSKAVASGLNLQLESVGDMVGALAAFAKEDNSVGVRQVALEKVDFSFGALSIQDVEADVRFDPERGMKSLDLRTSDRTLTLVATPGGDGVGLAVEAYAWRPFKDSRFVFDSAGLKVRLESGALVLENIDIHLLDGVLRGGATVGSGPDASVSGDIRFDRINTNRLGDALGIGKRFSGEVSGKLKFVAKGKAWEDVFSAMIAEGDFVIQRGTISGIDLVEAVRRVAGAPVQGGVTSFEQLSGRMKLAPEKNQFSALVMNSGLMQSTGYLDVAKSRKLSGKLELQLKGSVNQTRVPVLIDGTVDSPAVQAKRG